MSLKYTAIVYLQYMHFLNNKYLKYLNIYSICFFYILNLEIALTSIFIYKTNKK